MNLAKLVLSEQAKPRRDIPGAPKALLGVLGLVLVLSISPASAQVTVTTLGGGPVTPSGPAYGFANGSGTQESQFNSPYGCALDSAGDLYVADRDNGMVRKLVISSDLVTTEHDGLAKPVALTFDSEDNLYVACQGDGTIREFDRFGNPIAIFENFPGVTAIALDVSTNIYTTDLGGNVKRLSPAGDVTVLKSGLVNPRGVAVLDDGRIAVSEDHAIRLLDPVTSALTFLSGAATPGFTNGPSSMAKFNQPHQIAKAPNGSLVVADRMNHRVRLVDTNGLTTTLYGIKPSEWISDYPGWEDGSASFAEAREPVGVAVAQDGTVYTTEVFYHLIRSATGGSLQLGGGSGGSGSGGSSGGTNSVVLAAPTLDPGTGYFPMGQVLTIRSQAPDVFYTTDGSEPTQDSPRLSMTNGLGVIVWQERLRDLTSLRLKAFKGTNASVTVGGQAAATNNLGVPRDINAGIGSTVVVPIVANLRTNDVLRSIQFRVEVTPLTPAVPALTRDLRALGVSSNDFVPVAGAAEPGKIASLSFSTYKAGTISGLVLSAIGTNANLFVQGFGTVGMLAVTIPSTAKVGDGYRIDVIQPSGTSDGQQDIVEISPSASRTILVTNLSYIVGDTSFGGWYNAGDFGNGNLDNSDVNNVLYASLGVRLPYSFTDAFDAMDTFPDDTPGVVGGDGQIRFLDWQRVLDRSLRRDTNNWQRSWTVGGIRVPQSAILKTRSGNSPGDASTGPEGQVWFRPALLGAGSADHIQPDSTIEIPIYVNVKPGKSLAGLQFRASVETDGPQVSGQVQFVPAVGIPAPMSLDGLPANQVAALWPLIPSPSFNPPLQGSNVLGRIRFHVPVNAQFQQSYSIRFLNPDGAPDANTQYDFETVPGAAWVASAPLKPQDGISEEWKTTFFSSPNNPWAQADADPDGDGVPNWKEFLMGNDPVKLRLYAPEAEKTGTQLDGIKLRWFAAAGKAYVVECSPDLNAPTWNPITSSLTGQGDVKEVVHTEISHGAQFYRVRLQ